MTETEDKKDGEYDEQWMTPLCRLLRNSHNERYRKKLGITRRRMKNYFDGYNGIKEISVTVACLRNIVGIRVAVSSRFEKPGVKTTESFISEDQRVLCNEAALYYGLIIPIELKLHGIKTVIYYEEQLTDTLHAISAPLFRALKEEYHSLTFIPVEKGRILETLRRRIQTLHRNQVVPGYLSLVKERFEKADL